MNLKTALPVPAAALALTLAAAALSAQLRSLDSAWIELPAERSVRWHPRMVTAASLGQVQSIVDWLWVRAMTDPAIAKVRKGQHPPLYYDMDLATELDPAFMDAYVAGASLLAVVRDDAAGARDLLVKGMHYIEKRLPLESKRFRSRFWRQSWAVPMTLAYVYLFELDDITLAGDAFRAAAALQDAPDYIQKLGQRFSKPGGQYEVGLRLLAFMISGQTNEQLRATLEKKRESLYLSQYLFQLSEGFRAFIKSHPETITRVGPAAGTRRLWSQYRLENGIPETDPWGGTLDIDASGKVTSTTPRLRVFGLD